MRRDVASILIHMGHVLDRDFEAYAESRDSVAVKWFSQAPMPDEKAIDAAALEMEASQQAEAVKVAESTTARVDAKQAYSELEPLRSHKDPAIALLADVMFKHLLATLGR